MYKETIGIVGGFGAYATLNFYQRILEVFASECEREYPHIIMDNDFTMPSRTRALLTGEDYEEVVKGIAESLRKMCILNVDYIILPCGTAHAFLEDAYRIVPEAKDKVCHIIEITGDALKKEQVNEVLVIAAEGSMKNKIYSEKLEENGVRCIYPKENDYKTIRYFIECVKQNSLSEKVAEEFYEFLEGFHMDNVLLGCTEFPRLVRYISSLPQKSVPIRQYAFWDPLEMVLEKMEVSLK